MSDLADQLSTLSSGPVPPLAPAGLVRRRGEQHRRRTRTATALAGIAVVLAGTAVAVSLGSKAPDALQYAPQPSTTAPQPSATAPTTELDRRLLLQPEDGAAISGGTWSKDEGMDTPSPGLSVCPDEDPLGSAAAARQLLSDALSVTTQVIRYDARSAFPLLAELREAVGRCPSRLGDAEGGTSFRHELVTSPASDTVVVRETYLEGRTARRVSLWSVVGAGALVSYTELPDSEEPRLTAWIDAARSRMGTCLDDRCGQAPADASLTADDALRADGIGPIALGMTLAEAEAAAGQPFTAFKDDLGNGCGFVGPVSSVPRLSVMVVDGRVVRIDVGTGSSTRTDTGVGVGATEQQVTSAYPERLVVLRHDYTDGRYLRVTSADGQRVIVFETDGAVVTHIRAGTADAAGYNEGCA